MDKDELAHRIGSVVIVLGALAYSASQIAPFDLPKRQGVAFGLMAGLFIRPLYLGMKNGWDAANEAADNGLGLYFVVLALCALLTTPW